MDSYPNSGLGQVGPHRDFLPGAHVRVTVPLESGFQLLQLLAGEVSPLPPLLLFLGIVRVAVIAPVFSAPLLFCVSQIGAKLLCVTARAYFEQHAGKGHFFCIEESEYLLLNVERFRLKLCATTCKTKPP